MRANALRLVLIMAAAGVSGPSLADQPAPEGIEVLVEKVPVPNTRLLDSTGHPIALDALQGKTVVLNVWATWCAPCIKEMPSLDRLASRLDPSAALVLAVSQDKGGIAVARPFLKKLGVQKIKSFADPSSKLSRDLAIRGLPTSFLISPSGMIVGRVEGAIEWDSPDVVQFVTSIGRK